MIHLARTLALPCLLVASACTLEDEPVDTDCSALFPADAEGRTLTYQADTLDFQDRMFPVRPVGVVELIGVPIDLLTTVRMELLGQQERPAGALWAARQTTLGLAQFETGSDEQFEATYEVWYQCDGEGLSVAEQRVEVLFTGAPSSSLSFQFTDPLLILPADPALGDTWTDTWSAEVVYADGTTVDRQGERTTEVDAEGSRAVDREDYDTLDIAYEENDEVYWERYARGLGLVATEWFELAGTAE